MNERSLLTRMLMPFVVGGIVVIATIVLVGAGASWGRAAVVAASACLLVGGATVATALRRHSRDLETIVGVARGAGSSAFHLSAKIPGSHPLHDLATDVQRLRAEASRTAELAAEVQVLRSAFETLDASIAIVAPDGRVVYANAQYREMGTMPLDRVETNATVARMVTAARQSGPPLVETTEVQWPRRTLRLGAAALDDGHVVVSAIDASESIRLSAVRRDFVADASHELKTPIAAIQSSAETLRLALANGDEDAANKFTAYIVEHAARLGHLVNDLLDLSRIESETLDASPIDLARLVIDQVETARTEAITRHVALSVDAAPTMVSGNADNLSMAVRNLIANAIQNTPNSGKVTVAVRCNETTAEVKVSDNGRGIPTRDLPRLFERFYRVDHSRSRQGGGTGLGLAIVKHVAESHGGSIVVESALGEGSTFTLRIPCTDE